MNFDSMIPGLTNTNENEAQVRKLIENWAQAVRDRNLEAILASHSDDIVMYDVPKPFQSIGIDAYRKTWDLFFTYTKPGVFGIGELRVVADDNVAFCFVTMKCADKSKGGGEFTELDFRLTIGLQKRNNQWTIIYELHSVPGQ